MKLKHYEQAVRDRLANPAKRERHYLVPETGHGYTLDLAKAQGWAQQRARLIKKPVPVLYQDVEYSEWSIASDHIFADLEEEEEQWDSTSI